MTVFSERIPLAIKWIVGTNQGLEFVTLNALKEIERISFDAGMNVTLGTTSSTKRPLVARNTPLQPIPTPPSSSLLSAPVPTPDGGLLFISAVSQKLIQVNAFGTDVTAPELSAIELPLMDAIISYSARNKLWALYSGASGTRYRSPNNILGASTIEGYQLQVLKWDDTAMRARIAFTKELEGDDLVYQGLAPLWADLNQDGVDEIITTVAGSSNGTALQVYFITTSDGTVVELDKTITSPYSPSWFHFLAVGPLGPEGETELLQVKTPHTSGVIRYDRLSEQGEIVKQASKSEFTTHDLESRNLDMATVGDFNGDGIPEAVVQNQQHSSILGIQRDDFTFTSEAWHVDISAPLESNIAVACNDAGSMTILFSTSDLKLMRIHFQGYNNNDNASTSAGVHRGTSSFWTMSMILIQTVLLFLMR